MSLYCPKCLTGRPDDAIGMQCRTEGCDGVIQQEQNFLDLVEELPEPIRCPRRSEGLEITPGPDHWQRFKSNGNRVCSYCGSLHPDDFFAIVKTVADAGPNADWQPVPSIEPSDKSYKIYVRQPSVRNAHEGGIKFYTMHLPEKVIDEQQDDYQKAVSSSAQRFQRFLNQTKPWPLRAKK